MTVVPETKNFTPNDKLKIKKSFGLFEKPILYQYLILSSWTIAIILFLYYLMYIQSTREMVRNNILPSDVSWAWITAVFLMVLGFLLLLVPADKNLIEMKELKKITIQLLKESDHFMIRHEFDQLIERFTNHINILKAKGIQENIDNMVELQRRAQLNKDLNVKLEQIEKDMNTIDKRLLQSNFMMIQAEVMGQREIILSDIVDRTMHIGRQIFY